MFELSALKLVMGRADALIAVAKLTPLTVGGAVQARTVDTFTGFTTAMLADGVHPNKRRRRSYGGSLVLGHRWRLALTVSTNGAGSRM